MLLCCSDKKSLYMVQVAYTAVEAAPGRPRRAVTVRDAIGDLPPISNGADVEEMPFSGAPMHPCLLNASDTA